MTTKKIHPSITFDRIRDAIDADDNLGFCLSCGADAEGVEPDARHYHCEECGKSSIFGAEEILLSGHYHQ